MKPQTKLAFLPLALLFVCFSSTIVFSQDDVEATDHGSQEFTLSQAQAYALVNHYNAVNAELDLKISKKKIWEITASGLPQVSGSASYRHSIDLEFDFPDEALTAPGNEFLAIFGADNVSQGKLDATQLLFDGTYIVGLRAAKAYYKLSENQKKKSEVLLTSELTSSYYLVLVAEENIKILLKSMTNLKHILSETAALVEQGFLEETELNQLELTATKLNSSLLNAERSVQIAYSMLKLNMGYDVKKDLILKDKLEDIIEQAGFDALLGASFNLSSNTDFTLASTQRKLLKLNVDKFKMQRLPSLVAFYSYTNTAYQLEFDFYKDANWLDAQNVGISLNIPIWSSGMQGARIQQAKLELMKMDNTMEHLKNALQIQFNNSISQLSTRVTERVNAKKSLALAQTIYDRTVIKHKEGLASSFELSQMENQLLESQGAYINAIFGLLNAKVELDKLQNKN
ncbi:MAG: outer membrane protein [Saprospiraceae bacterium]|jgi:outer membrane protein